MLYYAYYVAFPVSPHWTAIKELYLDSNQLIHLPQSLSTLANLEGLSLSHNKLSQMAHDDERVIVVF
jgi:Leucine-rich repeat (LRR) protein